MLKLKKDTKVEEPLEKRRRKKLEYIIFTFLGFFLVIKALIQGHIGSSRRPGIERSEDPVSFWLFVGFFFLLTAHNVFCWFRESRNKDSQ